MSSQTGSAALAGRARTLTVASMALILMLSVMAALSVATATPARSIPTLPGIPGSSQPSEESSETTANSSESGKVRPEWGRIKMRNGVLRARCRNYFYRYNIKPPEGEWGLETFLRGPGGKPLASGAMVIGTDPRKGRDKFRICRPTTRPGVFKIRAKLSVQDKSGKNYREGWLPVKKFRLRARR